MAPDLTLHVIPGSHPCKAAEAALAIKGLEFEHVVLVPGEHNAVVREIYGGEVRTVPGLVADGVPCHGSRAIYEKLDELQPEPPFFPEAIADSVREAERWGDQEFQPLGRWFAWGASHFRPECGTTFLGGPIADPEGTDFAIGLIHGAWKYNEINAVKLAGALEGLPAKLDRVDELCAEGVIGGEQINAADLQIGSTVRIMLNIGDLARFIEGRPAEAMARAALPEYDGWIPEGAFPKSWIEAAQAAASGSQ